MADCGWLASGLFSAAKRRFADDSWYQTRHIPVRNQDALLKFYTEKLGFKVATDQPFSEKQRWIELQIPGADTRFVLFTPDDDSESAIFSR